MRIKHLLFGLLLGCQLSVVAQTKKEVLFTIDGKPYYTDEFSRVYKKNLDLVKDDSQKDLNQYLELFIGYKLKINKAYKLGLQDGEQYKTELKSYRNQLAKNYTTDSKVTSELVAEAYDRLQKEIHASHILILCDENAAPADTLKAYKQAEDLRKRALAGEKFEDLAVMYSQDPSAKENKGDLGYFTAFRMVYAFESAAYKTPKGSISHPVRTRFGYHLIKVNDVRENRGEVTVAHIMLANPSKKEGALEPDSAAMDAVKNQINDIYKKLQQGENFEALAKQFSEDKSSAPKGGVLNKFGSGQLSSEEFENVAFSLQKEGDISQPFQTQFGWHIVKLIARHPVRTLDQMKSELEGRVGRDERSRLIAQSMNEKLRKKYPVKRNEKLYTAAKKAVTDKFYEGTWEVPANTKPYEGKIVDLGEASITGVNFLEFVKAQQKAGVTVKPVSRLVDHLYDKMLDIKLNEHYNNNLENEFPEFSYVMDEYRDGLLLFDLMEREIWQKSKTDTIGLQAFYEANKANYNWKNRVEAIVISSTNEKMAKEAQKMLKKGKSVDEIKAKLNTDGKVHVMASNGVFEEGSDSFPKTVKREPGVTNIVKEGEYYFVAKIDKVLPAGPKTLEEARGKVINDYQQHLENNWVSDLKKEFTVSVNRDVFENVKKQL